MPGQLLPPPELAPPVPETQTVEQRIQMWFDLMDACEQFLLAGLRRDIGPDGDVKAVYRKWYAERMAEHDLTMRRMLEELDRRIDAHGH